MGESGEDFDETSARRIIKFLLKEDFNIYKKFLPDIIKFDSDSLYNMFKGNKNYKYKIKDIRYHFDFLLDKFDNFRYLLEEWYDDEDKYKYIQELWLNYVSLESLRERNKYEIESFLTKKKINYKNWPKEIKDIFLRIIDNTRNTVIYNFKITFQNLPEKIKTVLGTFYSLSNYFKKIGEKYLSKFVIEYIKSALGCLTNTDFDVIKGRFLYFLSEYTPSDIDLTLILDFLQENIFQIIWSVADGLKSTIASILYGVTCILKLFSSIKSCNDILEEAENIKELKKDVKTIAEGFRIQKEIILKQLIKEGHKNINRSNLIIENCITEINFYKKRIMDLICNINRYISKNKNEELSHGLCLASSLIYLGIGIAGGILSGGVLAAVYIGGAIGHGINGIIFGVNIGLLEMNNSKLKKIMENAEKVEDEIDKELWKIRKILNENKEVVILYYSR